MGDPTASLARLVALRTKGQHFRARVGADEPEVAGEEATDRRAMALVILWFVVAAIYLSWPLILHMPSRVPGDLADPLENAWIFAWGAHGLIHDPAHLFNANIFYAEPYTLAYAENMLGLSLPTAPIFWLTGNPVLQVNVALLAILAASGVSMYMLVRELTAKPWVALLAGTAYAWLPYRIPNFTHPHVSMQLVPLFLLLAIRLADRPTWRRVVVFALLLAWQFWASLTGGVVVMAGVGVWGLVHLIQKRREAFPGLILTGVAVLGGIVLTLPVLLPYIKVRNDHPEFRHSSEVVRLLSASPTAYLAPPALAGPVADDPYDWMRDRFEADFAPGEKWLWPGLLVAVGFPVAMIGWVVTRVRRRPPWPAFTCLAAVTFAGFVLSLGPRLYGRANGPPLPFALISVFSGSLLRVPARFGGLAAAGGVAAVGVAVSRLPRSPQIAALAMGFTLLAVEAMPVSTPFSVPPRITRAHRNLADGKGAILALPTTALDANGAVVLPALLLEPQNMYLSTAHFRPMVNGYGAVLPDSYRPIMVAAQDLPSDKAFAILKNRGVTTIVVQTELVKGSQWADIAPRLARWPGVRQADQSTGVIVFDIRRARSVAP